MKFAKLKKFFSKFANLETIEQKSFWIVAPVMILMGVFSLVSATSYSEIWAPLVLSILCVIIPVILMIIVSKNKHYEIGYPLLCILSGGVCLPLTFVFNGDFLSGDILFCMIATAITALCYVPKYRWISLFLCLVGNSLAFTYIYAIKNGSVFPLSGVNDFINYIENELGNPDVVNSFNEARDAISLDMMFAYYVCSVGMFVVINWVISDIRKYKLNQDALQRYFDSEKRKEIIKKAANTNDDSKAEHKNAVILFADISNFTTTTEKMSSDLVSQFLNDFFTIAGKHIHKTGGIIDKYIGDCIMAYWIDHEGENCVFNAIQSMLNLKHEVFQQSESIFEKYGVELNFSAGLCYGDVIFGDIGSETMHDFTIIGDAVNTASRIQGYATSGEMIISDTAAEKVKDFIILEKVETDHFFKGKNTAIDLYRILGLSTNKQDNNFEVKNDWQYKLTVCGCRGSFPVSGLRFSEYGGETSCYVIKKDKYACIVDCGTGLKNAIELISDCTKIDILLTHVHYDHILGFLMSKIPANIEVRIFGRFDKWSKSASGLVGFMEHPYWPIELVSAEKKTIEISEEIPLESGISAKFYTSDHPDDACVIRVMCGDKKVVFLADCEDATKLDNEISQDAEILFFDGMFDDKDKVSHKGWGHGTWQDGIRFLKGRNIKKLVITHHSPENGDHTLMLKENEARDKAQNVSFAKSGDTFNI